MPARRSPRTPSAKRRLNFGTPRNVRARGTPKNAATANIRAASRSSNLNRPGFPTGTSTAKKFSIVLNENTALPYQPYVLPLTKIPKGINIDNRERDIAECLWLDPPFPRSQSVGHSCPYAVCSGVASSDMGFWLLLPLPV